ncbi:MAG: 1-deoxy-D-xylulose-5-phosphate synthase [Lentisphaerae bacterium]|nr:1-deoxy-D-xylulose-5-phosphate synthase [Lentisphaerota bacterium]
MKLLDKINDPADLKALSGGEVGLLAGELREVILQTVARCGGHLGSNLGAVELTLALLRSFDLPRDRIVWDVGHQTYACKLLTGRQKQFENLRQFNGCCGFPVRGESEFDCYSAGHAGVAISAALGMCSAMTGSDAPNKVIAVVGDGAIGSGVALEGLNQVRERGKNLIIVLNDNKMAISPNVGAISRCLNRVMLSYRYRSIKNCAKALIRLLPKSNKIYHAVSRLEDGAKNLLLPGGPFQELGIRYIGPINGHDLQALERTFKAVQRDDRPVIIHVVTEKGRGYAPALAAPERFHGVGKFDLATGKPLTVSPPGFSAAFGNAVCNLAAEESSLTAVVAAMTGGVGLEKFAQKYPDRFYDAGMAESHAVSFSSGLAASGRKVICAIYATFMQRSLDNIFHDVCLMRLPVIFALDRAGLVEDGPTHHGIYDLGFLLGLPNLCIMQPACEAEVEPMLKLALQLDQPSAIRYPRGSSNAAKRSDIPACTEISYGKSALWRDGKDLAIYASGAEAVRAMEIADILARKNQLDVKVVNVRFLKPFDRSALQNDLQNMDVFTLEDHVAATGLGAVAAQAAAEIAAPKRLYTLGLPADGVVGFGAVNLLRQTLALDNDGIAGTIAAAVGSHR